MFRPAALLLLVLVLVSACSGTKKQPAGSTDDTSFATASTPGASVSGTQSGAAGKWDNNSVWSVAAPASAGAWATACGGRSPVEVKEDDPCIVVAMKSSGASQSAIAFYQAQKYFLESFSERGKVDYGQGAAPWMNMGRPTPQLFLNGSPDIIEAPVPQDFKTNASYAQLLSGSSDAFPWVEYGKLTNVAVQNGGEVLTIEFPLRVCRACEDLGYMPVAYAFDASGKMSTPQTQAFRPK